MPNHSAMPENNMQPELEVALVLLDKALQDLVVVQKGMTDTDISDEIIGFHAQQAMEKSLKAVLSHQMIDYPRTHNLRLLIDFCRNNDIQVPSEFLQVDIFNRFAVQWRYDLFASTTETTLGRETAYDLAHRVWVWADALVNEALS
jgi:HEPN domain-containing protein